MLKTLKDSLVERNARERAKALLDNDTFKELLDPFDGVESPHLEPQGIVPQSDDGVVVVKGKIEDQAVLIISLEGSFQGGGIGEVSGAKIAGALEKALQDNSNENKIVPILLFDTGGVRLQEANYGLLSIAEIAAAIVALRPFVPVIGIIPGKIGAYGGMSIVAGLCSAIIMTREGRLGLNGAEVIEQEAGIHEFDSKNRQLIWGTIGGEQRVKAGFADILAEDDVQNIKAAILSIMRGETSTAPRSSKIDHYLSFLQLVDPSCELTPLDVRELWEKSATVNKNKSLSKKEAISSDILRKGRGTAWFELLANDDGKEVSVIPSVRVADSFIGNQRVRYIAVVPDPNNRFPRARQGEFGVQEGWILAKHIREAIEEDKNKDKRAIIAIVDVPSQAYGYKEELLGIHQACAATVDAYASARLAGHPVIAFIPGKAISGAFLSHGMQANRLLALDDEGVNVHVMSKQSAARITMRSIEELEEAAKKVPAMAYDIHSFEILGSLYQLISGVNADNPNEKDREIITSKLLEAMEDVLLSGERDIRNRLTSANAINGGRAASILVRKKLDEQWN